MTKGQTAKKDNNKISILYILNLNRTISSGKKKGGVKLKPIN